MANMTGYIDEKYWGVNQKSDEEYQREKEELIENSNKAYIKFIGKDYLEQNKGGKIPVQRFQERAEEKSIDELVILRKACADVLPYLGSKIFGETYSSHREDIKKNKKIVLTYNSFFELHNFLDLYIIHQSEYRTSPDSEQ